MSDELKYKPVKNKINMKKNYISILVLGFSVIIASGFTIIYSSGIARHTGSPVDGATCNSCHSGGAYTPVGSIAASPAFGGSGSNLTYTPGITYTITINQTNTSYPDYGFGIEILNSNTSSASDAGSMTALSSYAQNNGTGPTNITHTSRVPTNTGATFTWIAPSSGTAYLYAAILGVNANGSTSGDQVTNFAYVLTPIGIHPACHTYYASLPYSTSFENAWVTDSCSLAAQHLPDKYWKSSIGGTSPNGNDYWHRDDYTGGDWTNVTTGTYTPAASVGSYSARFHNDPPPAGSIGSLDLCVDLSPAGTKQIQFDYIHNESSPSPFAFNVLLSTDSGATFPTTLLTLTSTDFSTWTTQTCTTSATSAKSFLRFMVTDKGTKDIGIDNLSVTSISLTGIDNFMHARHNFSIYPNPTNSILNVELGIMNETTKAEVLNMLGEVVYTTEIRNQKSQIDVSALPSGVYFVQVGTATQKFIKQ